MRSDLRKIVIEREEFNITMELEKLLAGDKCLSMKTWNLLLKTIILIIIRHFTLSHIFFFFFFFFFF